MKNLLTIIIAIVFTFCLTLSANAQLANWKANPENKNFAYFNIGYDFGMTNHLKTCTSMRIFLRQWEKT